MKIAPIIPVAKREVIESPEWVYELKLDGFRGIADTINGRMLSKNLHPFKRFQHLLDDLPLSCVFDGEICALDRDGKPDFNALLFGRRKPVYTTTPQGLHPQVAIANGGNVLLLGPPDHES
jgi:bifunctional non-homologous end joining protein LigD